MTFKAKAAAIALAAGILGGLGAVAPAQAQTFEFSLNLGRHAGPFTTSADCYWQRVDRRRADLVRQVCRDRFGRTYVVAGSEFWLADRNRRVWRQWRNGAWRNWDGRIDRRDRWDNDRWDRDNRRNNDRWDRDRRRDNDRWDRRDRRDRDRDRDRGRNDRRDRGWDRGDRR